MQLLLDTNIWIRHFTQDTEDAVYCTLLLKKIEEEGIHLLVSHIVILETSYILRKFYQVDQGSIDVIIRSMLSLRHVSLVEKVHTLMAWDLYEKYTIKFADCMIATQVPVNGILVSLDEEFDRLPMMNRKEPKDLLSDVT